MALQHDRLAVDIVLAAVITDGRIETGLAIAVQQHRTVARSDRVEIEILRLGIDIHRQTVLREEDLNGVERRNEISAEAVAAVRRVTDARSHVLRVVADVTLIVVREEVLDIVVEHRRAVVAHECRTVVVVTALEVVRALIVGLVESEAVGLTLKDGLLGRIHSLLPQLLVVGLRDKVRAVGVHEVAVPLRVAVHLRRGGKEPCTRLQRLGQRLGGTAPIEVVVRLGKILRSLVIHVRDELRTLQIGRTRYVQILVRRELVLDQNDRAVILQKRLVQVSDSPIALTLPEILLGLRGIRHTVGIGDKVIGVADTLPHAVVYQRACGILDGRLRPHGDIGVRRGLIVVVDHTLPLEVLNRPVESRHHIAAADLERRLEIEAVGHVPVERAGKLVGLDVSLVEVVDRGFSFGNHIEEITRGGPEGHCQNYD